MNRLRMFFSIGSLLLIAIGHQEALLEQYYKTFPTIFFTNTLKTSPIKSRF
jgi:hypothetical protein